MPPAPADTAPRLQLLRNPQLIAASGTATPLNANDAALVALLAVDGPTTRDRALALLWPEEDDVGRARNALRQRLFRLRRVAGFDLVSAGELLTLAPGVPHDLRAIREVLADNPAEALAGDLLGTLAYPGLGAFSDWLNAAREQWRSQRRDVLADIASQLEAQDRIAEALACAERLVRDEPLLEHAQRRLMRLHFRRGDRGAALATFARFRDVLERDLGDEPSSETLSLLRLVEANGALPVSMAPRGLTLLRPPRLVGRGGEWERILAARTQGRLVVVLGEPGIGKSRLLHDMAALAAQVSVSARPGDARVPYALLARLVNALVLPVAALDGWARAELARLVPALGEAPPGRIEARRLQQALEQALSRAAPGGVALDDLQFADEATLELLPALAMTPQPWLLAARVHESPALLADWLDGLDAERLTRIELGALDEAAVVELLESLALPGVDASWAPRVRQHSGGNPLFILETLRALLSGHAGPGDGTLPLPDNLRRLIAQRLGQLSPPAIKLARVASIAGPDFSVELAASVLGLHPLDLHDAWRELEAAQVMQGAAFAHDLVFETTRDAVPVALRRWLHMQVAGWLEARAGAPARLALHWREAGEPARAAKAFEQAARAAQAAGRLAEQARWLEAAIEAYAQSGQPRERFDAMVQRAIAAREAMSPPAAMAAADSLLGVATDDRELGVARMQVAACHMNAARFDLALPVFDLAIAASTAAHDAHTAQHARYLQALACAQVTGLAEALHRIEPLMPWAEAQPDVSLRHCFLADLAILYDQNDQRRRARPLFERALAHFDQHREAGNAGPTRTMLARSLVMLGDLSQARVLLEAAVRGRGETSEGAGGYGVEVLNLGRVYCELGLYSEAIHLLEPERERLQGAGSDVVHAASALVLARVYAHLGQAARALALFKEVPASAPFHQQATLLWTRSLLLAERPAERARLLDDALALFKSHTDLPFLRLPIEFDRLGLEPGAWALQQLRARVAECEQRELPAPQMLGRMRLLQVLCALADWRAALPVAHSLHADLAQCQPVGCYLPELHAACRSAAIGAGDMTLARACQDAAVHWIAAVAQHHLPEVFRDSFAHRNPINRAILTTTLGPR